MRARSFQTSAVFFLSLSGFVASAQEPVSSTFVPAINQQKSSTETVPLTQDFPLATPVEAVTGTPEPLDLKGKFDYYLKGTYGPQAIGRVMFLSSFSQARDSSDYGGGMSGHGQSFAARFATHTTRRTVTFGIGALHGEDPRFHRSNKDGFWNRTKFVLSRTVVADMDNGGTSFAAGRIGGAVAGGILSSYWMPDRTPFRDGLTNAGLSVAGDLGMRMVREFWPDIKRTFKK